jgi:hypothetical protein
MHHKCCCFKLTMRLMVRVAPVIVTVGIFPKTFCKLCLGIFSMYICLRVCNEDSVTKLSESNCKNYIYIFYIKIHNLKIKKIKAVTSNHRLNLFGSFCKFR